MFLQPPEKPKEEIKKIHDFVLFPATIEGEAAFGITLAGLADSKRQVHPVPFQYVDSQETLVSQYQEKVLKHPDYEPDESSVYCLGIDLGKDAPEWAFNIPRDKEGLLYNTFHVFFDDMIDDEYESFPIPLRLIDICFNNRTDPRVHMRYAQTFVEIIRREKLFDNYENLRTIVTTFNLPSATFDAIEDLEPFIKDVLEDTFSSIIHKGVYSYFHCKLHEETYLPMVRYLQSKGRKVVGYRPVKDQILIFEYATLDTPFLIAKSELIENANPETELAILNHVK